MKETILTFALDHAQFVLSLAACLVGVRILHGRRTKFLFRGELIE